MIAVPWVLLLMLMSALCGIAAGALGATLVASAEIGRYLAQLRQSDEQADRLVAQLDRLLAERPPGADPVRLPRTVRLASGSPPLQVYGVSVSWDGESGRQFDTFPPECLTPDRLAESDQGEPDHGTAGEPGRCDECGILLGSRSWGTCTSRLAQCPRGYPPGVDDPHVAGVEPGALHPSDRPGVVNGR